MIMPTNLPVRQARSLRIAALQAPPTMLIAVLLAALAVALLIVYQNRFSSKEYNASLVDYAATMM
jgi:Tfp pilus assembly protein PilN